MQPDGKVLFGGLSTTVNGTNYTPIARLNANGSVDATFGLVSGTGAGGIRAVVDAIALLAAGCASVPSADSQADDPVERAQIEHRLQEIFAAATAKDFNRLDGYHLYGPKFTKFSGSSPERLDAEASRKGEHEGLGSIKGLKMRADTLKIDVFGPVGIATFILDYSFDSGGETVHAKERATMIFVKEGGAWKIAHEHLSPMKP